MAAKAAEPVLLTSLQAVHLLSNTEASQAVPVAAEGTVVYSRGYESLLFVQDGDVALFVRPPAPMGFLPGDRIFIKGKTQGSFRPLLVASAITLLHHGALPKPVSVTFDELIHAHSSQLGSSEPRSAPANLVVTPGAPIRSASLQLLMEGGHIEVYLDDAHESALKSLLDSEVEITGAAAGKFDDKMQETGIVLYVSSLANVKVLKRGGTGLWSLPITPMDQILSSYHVQESTRRVQVHGTITYYQPGSAVVLQDGSKSLWISTHTREPLQIGDLADGTGFPDAHDRLLTDGGSSRIATSLPPSRRSRRPGGN